MSPIKLITALVAGFLKRLAAGRSRRRYLLALELTTVGEALRHQSLMLLNNLTVSKLYPQLNPQWKQRHFAAERTAAAKEAFVFAPVFADEVRCRPPHPAARLGGKSRGRLTSFTYTTLWRFLR